MSEIIEKLRKNPFNTVNKWHYKCPECGDNLYYVDNHMDMVMGGNTVAHCENNEDHVFWQNARGVGDVLHLNIHSSSTNFDSDKDYKLTDGVWNVL